MFGFNDHTTVRLLAEDRYRTYRPAPRRSLRRAAREAAGGSRRHS